jgi:hypothetical protein
MRICGRLKLTDGETKRVEGWLELPPAPEEVDPTTVPPEHRQLFLTVAAMMINADGHVTEAEHESLRLFRDLLSGS